MPTFKPLVHFEDGGGQFTLESGGKLLAKAGGIIDASAGTLTLAAGQIAQAQQAAIPNNAVGGLSVAHFHYDATVQGGTQAGSPIAVAGKALIPAHAYVLGGELIIGTIAAGVGASVALQLEGANDVIAAAAISGAPWSTTGKKAIVPVFSSATAILTTAARDLGVVVTAADLTALVFDCFLVYFVTA